MIPGRKHSFETLIFKHVYFDTMIDVKIDGKENPRVRIGRIAFTAEDSNL